MPEATMRTRTKKFVAVLMGKNFPVDHTQQNVFPG